MNDEMIKCKKKLKMNEQDMVNTLRVNTNPYIVDVLKVINLQTSSLWR